jgi:uncharacterized protein
MLIEKIYVDTSAFYALLDRSDQYHEQAKEQWPSLLEDHIALMTSNYVVSETISLLQHRLGFEAALIWHKDIMGIVEIAWTDASTHRKAIELWLNLCRHRLSLCDCTSYIIMRQHRIEKVFSFKKSYADQGFALLPQNPPLSSLKVPN